MNGQQIPWTEEADKECRILVELALLEDTAGKFDCTTDAIVDPQMPGAAAFVSRASGVVCGLKPAELVCELQSADLSLEILIVDGGTVQSGDVIAVLRGSAADILTIERTCLNFMGRLSSIASLATAFVAQTAGTSARIFDTRKTIPGWRHLEKYAVRCGGAQNHRIGLFDAILIKDNHLAFVANKIDHNRSMDWAVHRAREWIQRNLSQLPHGTATTVQVEVDRLDQLERCLMLDVDMVLLDNMSLDQMRQAVEMRNRINPAVQLEVSGGVNLQTVNAIAQTGVERISSGAITHSAVNFDIGLDWIR